MEYFTLVKMRLTHRREKHTRNVKYIICFDTWPHIDNWLFVTVTASDNVSQADFSQVCESLQLPKLAMKVGYVDIDKAYEERYQKKSSEIRQIRFNIPLATLGEDAGAVRNGE